MGEVTEQELEDIEALFVQTAHSLTSEGGKSITLHGLSPSTIYFADRPQREVGHMSTNRFVDLWSVGDNSFETDPPNAVLSFAEPQDRAPEEVVVTIRQPTLQGDSLTFEVDVLDGTLPASTGPVPCSSTRSGGRCRRFPQPECTVASGAANVGFETNRLAEVRFQERAFYVQSSSSTFRAWRLNPTRPGRTGSLRRR